MIRSLLCAATLAVTASTAFAAPVEMPSRLAESHAEAPATFRAPNVPARSLVKLAAPQEKAQPVSMDDRGRLRVGSVRGLAKAAPAAHWTRVADGYVTRFTVTSSGAEGLRVKLALGAVPGALDVRMQGADGRIESMLVDPTRGPEAWTAWTEGETQLVEIFSAVAPSESAVSVADVLHFAASPFAKAAGTCTVPTMCTTNNPTLDSAIAQAKKSIMRLQFIEDGSGFVCTGTLINTERAPTPYVLTANHCIDNSVTANTVTTLWFYENQTCDPSSSSTVGRVQVTGGMQLVFHNFSVDTTLMILNGQVPNGAVYSAYGPTTLSEGTAIVSLSHPAGDAARLALGNITEQYGIEDRPQPMYGVRFTRGIIEGGSSGSGLFTLSGNQLVLRSVLSGTTVRNDSEGMSCTNTNEEALYTHFDVFEKQMNPFVRTAGPTSDDAPNRVVDFAAVPNTDPPLDQRGSVYTRDNMRIDYAGDVDVYRFTLSAPAVVSAWTEGANGANLDTVGQILDSRGSALEADDDAQSGSNHFGITRSLPAGTYYVQVEHFDATGTGSYNLRLRADNVPATNYTDLWSNATENGWGLSLNHQGNTIFASLYTYAADGIPMWLVMSNGDRQPDGSYQGTLYRATGPAFNASPWHAANLTQVGTMRLVFAGSNSATLTYTVEGTQVTKSVTRFRFGADPTSCTWSAFDRSYTFNYQDLWLTPSEPGWGLAIAHQGSTLFASLYTYDPSGRDVWLVMSAGAKQGDTERFTGPLYRTSGPAFNAVPWTTAGTTQVGTMTLTFTNGNRGTLTYTFNGTSVTKQIQRYTFGALRPSCES